MPSIEYDLKYIQAGLVDLEGYLLSKELYWPVGASAPAGETHYPRLTLGNLLLARARLSGRDLDPQQRAEFERLDQRLQEISKQWQVAWGQKAAREFSARLKLWRDFLDEYRKQPNANLDRYAYEVSRRVTLQLLSSETREIHEEEADLLHGLDELLRAVFIPGQFVWDMELKASFPKSTYWYLYGMPKEEL
jgi:hypothetical protein